MLEIKKFGDYLVEKMLFVFNYSEFDYDIDVGFERINLEYENEVEVFMDMDFLEFLNISEVEIERFINFLEEVFYLMEIVFYIMI